MSGLPFSGKTTLSKQISQSLGIKRISYDEVWNDTKNIPGKNDIEKWKFISQKCEELVVDELQNNRSVIYDNLGDRLEHRHKMRQIALNNNADFKLIFLNISTAESIKRRLANVTKKDHHPVSDQNFNNALSTFEIPSSTEYPTIYNSDQSVEELLKLFL